VERRESLRCTLAAPLCYVVCLSWLRLQERVALTMAPTSSADGFHTSERAVGGVEPRPGGLSVQGKGRCDYEGRRRRRRRARAGKGGEGRGGRVCARGKGAGGS